MEDNIKRCPSCGKSYEDENLIVCVHCGAELHTSVGADTKKYNIFTAYKAMFTKFFDFRSRSGRGEYWYAYLANFIIVAMFTAALLLIDYAAAANLMPSGDVREGYVLAFNIVNYISLVYSLVVLIPQLALIVRRLHDTNRSAVYVALLFAAPVGTFVLVAFLVMRGTRGANRYGVR